jgi:hypothetical protein
MVGLSTTWMIKTSPDLPSVIWSKNPFYRVSARFAGFAKNLMIALFLQVNMTLQLKEKYAVNPEIRHV